MSIWIFPELVAAMVADATMSSLSLEDSFKPPVDVPCAKSDASEREKGMK